MLGDVGNRKADGREVGLIRRFCTQLNLGPVTDKGDVGERLRKLSAREIRLPLLPFPGTAIPVWCQVIAVSVLQGRNMVQQNHLPIAGFLFSKQSGQNLIVPAERNAARAIADEMDTTGRVGQGNLDGEGELRHHFHLLIMVSVVIVILIRSRAHKGGRNIFFQITGTTEDGNMHGLQLMGLSQILGYHLVSGNGEGYLYLAFRLHRHQIRLLFTGTGQGRQRSRCYDNPLSHRALSPQVNILGRPLPSSTRSSPQYQVSYTQRSRATETSGFSVIFLVFLSTFTAPLADQ